MSGINSNKLNEYFVISSLNLVVMNFNYLSKLQCCREYKQEKSKSVILQKEIFSDKQIKQKVIKKRVILVL